MAMPIKMKMTAVIMCCAFTLSMSNINLSNLKASIIKTGNESCCILINNNSGTIEILNSTPDVVREIHEKIGAHKSKIGKIN